LFSHKNKQINFKGVTMKALFTSIPGSLRIRLFTISFVSLFVLTINFNLYSQTPQYFNANSGGEGNFLPFGSMSAPGYKTHWLIGPGEYIQPSPAPRGDITKLYIYMSTSGTGTYTNLTIMMGQAAITSFPPGIYNGTLDTVYFRASESLSSVINTWLIFTLDTSFSYDPAESLIIVVSHCGVSGNGMNLWQIEGTTGIFRRHNIPGNSSCVFINSSRDTRILQNGIDISPPVGIVSNNNELPVSFKLEQNYPNPFNPVTNISFTLPQLGIVELRVFNSLGIEVAALLNSFMNAGNYSVSFDASGLPSGVYFYTLSVNNFSETKKMLMIK
jgi:hypothetical protein